MTTEDDFQAHLDAHPDDHYTRLVFADWLQDRDDPRAEGYRALGAAMLCPDPALWAELCARDERDDLTAADGSILSPHPDASGRLESRPDPRVDYLCLLPMGCMPALVWAVRLGHGAIVVTERDPRYPWAPAEDRVLVPIGGYFDGDHWSDYERREGTRRETEDAAALALAAMPEERRAELLAWSQTVAVA